VYRGQVIYGRDAFADLRFMDAFVAARDAEQWDNGRGFLAG
jgi:5-methyltetrahydrofolate--homocysteine methyltransferase